MSKYIKLDDAINAYNQAVKELVEKDMGEFDLCHFTECSFNTTQIMLIAQRIESLPTIEVSERVGRDIHCPEDIGFENTFHDEDCKTEQFYNNCYHCWSSAIAKRCHKERQRDAEDERTDNE